MLMTKRPQGASNWCTKWHTQEKVTETRQVERPSSFNMCKGRAENSQRLPYAKSLNNMGCQGTSHTHQNTSEEALKFYTSLNGLTYFFLISRFLVLWVENKQAAMSSFGILSIYKGELTPATPLYSGILGESVSWVFFSSRDVHHLFILVSELTPICLEIGWLCLSHVYREVCFIRPSCSQTSLCSGAERLLKTIYYVHLLSNDSTWER